MSKKRERKVEGWDLGSCPQKMSVGPLESDPKYEEKNHCGDEDWLDEAE